MTQARTKQGQYLARVITAKATINPASQQDLALALQRITDHHGGNQADAIRTAIALYAQMLNNPR